MARAGPRRPARRLPAPAARGRLFRRSGIGVFGRLEGVDREAFRIGTRYTYSTSVVPSRYMGTTGIRRVALVTQLISISCGAVALVIACSGSGKQGDSKTPAGAGSDKAGASSGVAPGDSTSGGTSGGTTTTNLPNSGELQGAKLGSSTHSEGGSKGDGGPKGTHGQSANEPGRTRADIETIIKLRRDDARACYDKALAAHPNSGIEGDLTIKWKITPEGDVTDAELDTTKSQIMEPTVVQCIVDIIKKIKFAKSDKGYETRANYPFNFHPRNVKPDAGAKK